MSKTSSAKRGHLDPVLVTRTHRGPRVRQLDPIPASGGTDERLTLRLPASLAERLRQSHAVSGSLNSAIVGLVQHALDDLERRGAQLRVQRKRPTRAGG